jgi:hypothetical protein
MMTKEERETARTLKKGLGRIDQVQRERSYAGAAIGGAFTGMLVGYFAHFKDKGHREIGKHALAGAGIALVFELAGDAIFGGMSRLGHAMEKDIETGRYRITEGHGSGRFVVPPGQAYGDHLFDFGAPPGPAPRTGWEPWEHHHHHLWEGWR